ncbi:hypothetical protein Hypma_007408 [Hypsizygus marmoreus]|uniref:Uncharacterized protein n=1 Tax=Hypsizygus marmoreus TaxID=39966 RepID=A0A369JUW5_HYPMA|nr:hypothetical protein Hypma_007408 [Hypsizygus marmoreus]
MLPYVEPNAPALWSYPPMPQFQNVMLGPPSVPVAWTQAQNSTVQPHWNPYPSSYEETPMEVDGIFPDPLDVPMWDVASGSWLGLYFGSLLSPEPSRSSMLFSPPIVEIEMSGINHDWPHLSLPSLSGDISGLKTFQATPQETPIPPWLDIDVVMSNPLRKTVPLPSILDADNDDFLSTSAVLSPTPIRCWQDRSKPLPSVPCLDSDESVVLQGKTTVPDISIKVPREIDPVVASSQHDTTPHLPGLSTSHLWSSTSSTVVDLIDFSTVIDDTFLSSTPHKSSQFHGKDSLPLDPQSLVVNSDNACLKISNALGLTELGEQTIHSTNQPKAKKPTVYELVARAQNSIVSGLSQTQDIPQMSRARRRSKRVDALQPEDGVSSQLQSLQMALHELKLYVDSRFWEKAHKKILSKLNNRLKKYNEFLNALRSKKIEDQKQKKCFDFFLQKFEHWKTDLAELPV